MKHHPVTEIFGPTIQGEGELQGTPSFFVRFGGCEYRCEWCDTPHAVLPQAVRQSRKMTAEQIVDELRALTPGPKWVVLTGGNPALHDLTELVDKLHTWSYRVAVETQGAKFSNWLKWCDSLCVSPKPPSAKLSPRDVEIRLSTFMRRVMDDTRLFFKVVVFDQTDYEWARELHERYKEVPMYLSAGNDAGRTVGNPSRIDERTRDQIARDLIRRFRWLTNYTMVDTRMCDVRIQSQQHVLLWGNERGH